MLFCIFYYRFLVSLILSFLLFHIFCTCHSPPLVHNWPIWIIIPCVSCIWCYYSCKHTLHLLNYFDKMSPKISQISMSPPLLIIGLTTLLFFIFYLFLRALLDFVILYFLLLFSCYTYIIVSSISHFLYMSFTSLSTQLHLSTLVSDVSVLPTDWVLLFL